MIISGIGFIGGGAIMRSKFNVTGLASAATIWGLGSLGILIGSGQMLLALQAALIMFVLLRVIPKLEHLLFHRCYCLHSRAMVRHDSLNQVLQFLMEHQIYISSSQIEQEEDRVVLTLNECGIESRPQLLASLHDVSGVLEVTDYLDKS